MKTSFILITALIVLAAAASAQERSATGTMETQMTWSALKTLVDGAVTKSDAANKRIDQIVLCGKKNMLYAPGVEGADGDGCTSAGSEYKGPLLAGSRTGEDCLDEGGRPKNIGNGYICVFGSGMFNDPPSYRSADICPNGWSPYDNWSRTIPQKCQDFGAFGSKCTTTGHGSFANIKQETCGYSTTIAVGGGGNSGMTHNAGQATTCSAIVTLRGCL